MLRLALLLLAAIASQALLLQPGAVSQSRTRTIVMSKINESIDKENPKVVTMVKAKEIEGAKAVYCRCWKSATFPMCDGAHVKHNKETEDNVGPLIVEK